MCLCCPLFSHLTSSFFFLLVFFFSVEFYFLCLIDSLHLCLVSPSCRLFPQPPFYVCALSEHQLTFPLCLQLWYSLTLVFIISLDFSSWRFQFPFELYVCTPLISQTAHFISPQSAVACPQLNPHTLPTQYMIMYLITLLTGGPIWKKLYTNIITNTVIINIYIFFKKMYYKSWFFRFLYILYVMLISSSLENPMLLSLFEFVSRVKFNILT